MLLKYFLLSCFVILSFESSSGAQTKQDKIRYIRSVFERINSASSLTTRKLENEEYLEHMTDGGGQLTGYYSGDTLQKITNWVGVSSGIIKIEYYFDGGRPVFIYEVHNRFAYNSKLNQRDYSKQKTVFECRFYISNGSLIKVVKKGELIGRTSEISNTSTAKVLMEETQNYSMLLITKGKRG